MGLDMYLSRKIWIGGEYEHRKATGSVDITFDPGNGPQHVQLKATEVNEITSRVGYWRKANAIHAWFVRECQDGRDECEETEVSREKLMELLALCRSVLASKDPTPLPPQEGFFFGSTKIDDGYWQDITDTITILEKLPEGEGYTYRSSW